MSNKGEVVAVNISEKKGTSKHSVPKIIINEQGIVGDAHAGNWHRQISLLNREGIDEFVARSKKLIKCGDFGENITISGLDFFKFAILDQLQIGKVRLEITQIGKECHGNKCAIYRETGECIMPQAAAFCRVVRGGKVKPDNEITHIVRPLQILIITLSDRAFAKEYQDKSGKVASEILTTFFAKTKWHTQIKNILLPDDPKKLQQQLKTAVQQNIDIIFTLGGTGVGPRDITPEIVAKFCDKIASGVMEHIRLKYGAQNPMALLSRSIFGTKNKTQIYSLPGSVAATIEYLEEVLKIIKHVIFMLHGIDVHAK